MISVSFKTWSHKLRLYLHSECYGEMTSLYILYIFSERYGDKDLESSYLVASDFVQNPAEYIDIIETSDTQTQTAGQVADYATLHPSTRS